VTDTPPEGAAALLEPAGFEAPPVLPLEPPELEQAASSVTAATATVRAAAGLVLNDLLILLNPLHQRLVG
jgi:hypothetical protein